MILPPKRQHAREFSVRSYHLAMSQAASIKLTNMTAKHEMNKEYPNTLAKPVKEDPRRLQCYKKLQKIG